VRVVEMDTVEGARGGRLCLLVIAAYFALALYGEVQYRVARARSRG